MLFLPFACNMVCVVHRPISVSLAWLWIRALVGPIAICMTPPGLWFDVVSCGVESVESVMENLLLGQRIFICARSGMVEFSGFLQFNFVSVNPIIVGSSIAAFANKSCRSIRFDGSPLMFCSIIRSRACGRGSIGVGPHVVFVGVRLSVVLLVLFGVGVVVSRSLLLSVVVCRGLGIVLLLLLLVCSVVSWCVVMLSCRRVGCGGGFVFALVVISFVVVNRGAVVVGISVVVVDFGAVVVIILFHGFVVLMIVFVAVLYTVMFVSV